MPQPRALPPIDRGVSDDAALVAELDASGLFDASWYILQYPDVRDAELEPLAHFHRHGWRQGHKPNRYFDPEWYLDHYPDVRQAGMNPLLHFIRHGDHEGRSPGQHFDAAWYRRAYDIPKDALTLAHFLIQRTSGRFAPVPELWAVMHLSPYRDDPSAGEDPFEHYLDDMGREGREPFPDILVVAASGLIDPCCYRLSGSDMQKPDLAEHFCREGWNEGRNPNLYFDIQWYRQTNPGTVRLNINPLVHYVLEGERAERRPIPFSIQNGTARLIRSQTPSWPLRTSCCTGSGRLTVLRLCSTLPGM